MSGFLFADGHFPFAIPNASGEWDGSTRFSDAPSMSATENQPAVGEGTRYPLGLTLEQASALYWRVKAWKVTFNVNCDFGSGLGGDMDSDITFPMIMDNDAVWPFSYPDWPWVDDGSGGKVLIDRAHVWLPSVRYPTAYFGVPPIPITRKPFGSTVGDQHRTAVFDASIWTGDVRAYAWDNKIWPYFSVDSIFGVGYYAVPASGTGVFWQHMGVASGDSYQSKYTADEFEGDSGPTWEVFQGPSVGVPYSTYKEDNTDSWVVPVTLDVSFHLLATTQIPMYLRITSVPYIPDGMVGNLVMEPYKYHTYGGIYDEDTGERV